MKYDATTKNGETMQFATTWLEPEDLLLSKVSQKKTDIGLSHLYMKYRITQ